MKHRHPYRFFIAPAMLVALLSTGASAYAFEADKTRVVVFPSAASLGRLYQLKADQSINLSDNRGNFLGEARGKLTVPAKALLFLDLDPTICEDPSKIIGTQPDAVHSLRAKFCEFTDKTLAQLCTLSSLERLDVIESEVTDQGMQSLTRLKNLHRLALPTSQIKGAGIKYLQQIPALTVLNLSFNPLGPEAINTVAELSNLQDLNISGCHINNQSMQALAKLKHLDHLVICQNPDITGSGIICLRSCSRLNKLEVRNTGIKARDLLVLKGLPLKYVYISEERLPADVTAQLNKAFPGCSFVKVGAINSEDKTLFAPVTR